MALYNNVKVKLSDSELYKLKSAAKNAEKVTSRLSSNMIGNTTDDTNFLHKILLTAINIIIRNTNF